MRYRKRRHLFIAGVPATGKSWLGVWLAESEGYLHVDAERDGGADFDRLGIHVEWDELVATGRASGFVDRLDGLASPVILNWGFPTRFLYVVAALQDAGVETWWFDADREQARNAFVRRGGLDPNCFDAQMDAIDRERLLINMVFRENVVQGLSGDGSQRDPAEIWRDMT